MRNSLVLLVFLSATAGPVGAAPSLLIQEPEELAQVPRLLPQLAPAARGPFSVVALSLLEGGAVYVTRGPEAVGLVQAGISRAGWVPNDGSARARIKILSQEETTDAVANIAREYFGVRDAVHDFLRGIFDGSRERSMGASPVPEPAELARSQPLAEKPSRRDREPKFLVALPGGLQLYVDAIRDFTNGDGDLRVYVVGAGAPRELEVTAAERIPGGWRLETTAGVLSYVVPQGTVKASAEWNGRRVVDLSAELGEAYLTYLGVYAD